MDNLNKRFCEMVAWGNPVAIFGKDAEKVLEEILPDVEYVTIDEDYPIELLSFNMREGKVKVAVLKKDIGTVSGYFSLIAQTANGRIIGLHRVLV